MSSTTRERRALDRPQLLQRSRHLAWFTIAWNVTEGVIAITAALLAGSQALLGFGVDSAVESVSASVLAWRLSAEERDPERVEAVERRALQIIGATFLLLAAVVGFEAVRALLAGDVPDASPVGIGLTALSLVVMPALAIRKRRVADELDSRAAVADSQQTWACAWLSAIVLGGLLLNATLGWWWADPIAALVVVALLVREGRDALTAEQVDDCC
jgi:divalent metal cation (Fe/Co/Zn/Cd) transporter